MSAPLPNDPNELLKGESQAAKRFRELVRRRVSSYFRRESQIHDVTQDALLELLRKLSDGERPSDAAQWVHTAARNAVRRELTRINRRVVEYESALHGLVESDQVALLDAREDLRRITALLDEEGELAQRALASSARGSDHNELAAELGLSPGAARMTLSRARAKLHDRLSAQQKISHLVQLAKSAGLIEQPEQAQPQTRRSPEEGRESGS